jgi:exodeoxyribonuclease-3
MTGRKRTRLRVATWNVNSIRLRFDGLKQLMQQQQPDVICMQEIKVADDLFPRDFFVEQGYPHLAISGQKAYHGVAIASRLPIAETDVRRWCSKTDCRHISVRVAGKAEIHNFYVPAGGDVPDPAVNEKFAHKLQFIEEMTAWSKNRAAKAAATILVGDLNIAPLETDVWSHKQLLKVVSHTPVETEGMKRLIAAGTWFDAMRHFVPPDQKLFTWWSYRSPDWAAADKGRRLDHVWVTPDLKGALRSMEVVKPFRAHQPASDHVPVVVELDLP